MGLGKTIQALAFVSALSRETKSASCGPVLIVGPAALVENWRREAVAFTPMLKTLVHHGNSRLKQAKDAISYSLVFTSYATVTNDIELFRDVEWSCVIADEAQFIKNRKTKNAKALRSLQAKGRFILTGTPIENHVDDLRSLFAFLMPGFLSEAPKGAKQEERQWYDERSLQRAAPYILRRSKNSVIPELPKKIEQVIYCEMESRQRTQYRELEKSTQQEIMKMEMNKVAENQLRFTMFQQLLRLRQLCAEPRILEENLDPVDSVKREVLLDLLESGIESGARFLVFSQFVKALRWLAKDFEEKKIAYHYIDGETPAKERVQRCEHFNQNPAIAVFLISLKAGGTGLNLTGANTVVHLDPWWNPAVEAQATDRAHRIGQTRAVTSIRLITSGTIEERVLDLQKRKARLLNDLLEVSDASSSKIELEDMKALVGSGR